MAGFKSIACYRTGLDVSPVQCPLEDIELSLMGAMRKFEASGGKKLRLEEKVFNDYLVRLTMEVAGKFGKPGELKQTHASGHLLIFLQFNSTQALAILTLASPSHLQLTFNP